MCSSYSDKVCGQIRSFVKRHGWELSEKDEDGARRFDVRHGKSRAVVKVYYSTGTILVQASPISKLKEPLERLKQAIEDDSVPIGDALPFEIEAFPDILQSKIPSVDPVIPRLLNEAILCLKANALYACAFLVGAASEKAIRLLIEAYTESIGNETNRSKFQSRVSNRNISQAYDEFKRSFKSCKSKPRDSSRMQDLNVQIDALFQFYRICRNEVGHPQLLPNLDRGSLIANLGQFVKYIEAIYRLIDYFAAHETVL